MLREFDCQSLSLYVYYMDGVSATDTPYCLFPHFQVLQLELQQYGQFCFLETLAMRFLYKDFSFQNANCWVLTLHFVL